MPKSSKNSAKHYNYAPCSDATRDSAGHRSPSAAARVAGHVLWLYQACLSPFLPASCRFAPSCSAFGRAALVRHGAARGGWLTLKRLLRCHPWNPGGWDPVP